MGTTYSVKVVTGSRLEPVESTTLGQRVQEELDGVNARMSTYLADSELSRLNQHADDTPFAVSGELLRVLETAREVGVATRGAYDITVGPLVDAWGFGPGGRIESAPAPSRLAELEEHCGWEQIEIDAEAGAVRKATAAVRCDLSGIAKGFAVDRVSTALAGQGYGDHMVEVGGEVRTSGLNRSGEAWRIAIESPSPASGRHQRVLPLSGLALATSGDYRNYFEEGGVRYSHIIDPRTAQPIRHRLASVSVVAECCDRADALATGLLVLGEQEGWEVAVENDLAVLMLVRSADGSFEERATPRFDLLLTQAGESGDDQ